MSSGKIVQVIGPVVDVEFSLDQSLPDINNALVVYKNGEAKQKVVLEVALELGDGVIRSIAMESTEVYNVEWKLSIQENQFQFLLVKIHWVVCLTF